MSLHENQTRLFFAINLIGSTAYKQEAQRQQQKWQVDFLRFYYDFPQYLKKARDNHERKVKQAYSNQSYVTPVFSLWKAIGDELLFVADVEDYRQVKCAVDICLEAQNTYEDNVLRSKFKSTSESGSYHSQQMDCDGQGKNKGVGAGITRSRGAVFAATFKGPDSVVAIPLDLNENDEDFDYVQMNKKVIDQEDKGIPSTEHYTVDYIGPSIDIGFHLVSKSSYEFFTMSVEVAWCYSLGCKEMGSTDHRLTLIGQSQFKGVWNGRNYPVFAIDRYDDLGDKVRNVLHLDHEAVIKICDACSDCEDWPSRLFLPKSPMTGLTDSQFKKMTSEPIDVLSAYESDAEGARKDTIKAATNQGGKENAQADNVLKTIMGDKRR